MTRRPKFRQAASSARDLAAEVVYLCDQDGMYANVAWSQALSGKEMDPRDRRFAMEIAYGSIRRKKTLDWVIDQASTRPSRQMDPLARALLRTGAYQLMFMSRVPPHAAVSESVNSARRLGHRGLASFVNAVLRRIASPGYSPEFPDRKGDPVGFLSVSQSYPEWLVRLWIDEYEMDVARTMLEAGNEAPTVVLRANRRTTDRSGLSRLLASGGVPTEPGFYCPEALRISGAIDGVESLPGYDDGLFSVQDESSMLVGHVMGVDGLCSMGEGAGGDGPLGERPLVIDTCAAPGGKATHIAELGGDRVQVVACDLSEERVSMIQEAAARLELSSLQAVCCDARELPQAYSGKADAVLVDAPCSGFGVLSRRPDARWRKSPGDIEELSALQAEILDAAAQCVKPGGVLVYSTCTVGFRENRGQAERFAAKHEEFSPSAIGPYMPSDKARALCSADGYIVELLPGMSGTDGFFIARFVRESGSNG
ncbi:MAG: 16S rRNA (cytosine(967)-C(5))-methyltransferase RsmB [Firmicutes bacterium]|nr:16S rRNA (cytosine(967)-C(5))-methyltransferase RsmB [Bacillota bacterium]